MNLHDSSLIGSTEIDKIYRMPILAYNVPWMLFNIFLALLALGFGYIFIKSKNTLLTFIFGILWILFLPNTIYLFTDLEHLIDQWSYVTTDLQFILFLQYVVFVGIGFASYLFAFYPFEKIILAWNIFKKNKIFVIVAFNYFIAFGMVLGRVERINSWEVFTNPVKVISSAVHVFHSVDLFGLMLLFGILCNCFYFLFRDRVLYTLRRFK